MEVENQLIYKDLSRICYFSVGLFITLSTDVDHYNRNVLKLIQPVGSIYLFSTGDVMKPLLPITHSISLH
jgi:hypothetical protein